MTVGGNKTCTKQRTCAK